MIVRISLIGLIFSVFTLAATAHDQKHRIMRLVVDEAVDQGFPPSLALAVADVESDFRPRVISSAGARGVMQIMPRTAWDEYRLSRSALFDPQTNIYTGIHFLNSLIEHYGNVSYALSHYNGGSAVRTPSGTLRIIPATRRYVAKVLRLEKQYRHHPLVLQAKLRPRSPHVDLARGRTVLDGVDVATVSDRRRGQLARSLRSIQQRNSERHAGLP